MKRHIINIGLITVSLFALFAFATWSINPGQWTLETRGWYAGCIACSVIIYGLFPLFDYEK